MAILSGERKTWHKITLDFATEATFGESPSTFRDYRLDVVFANTDTGETYRVPGFFAADGDAADTGATSGNVWRVNFTPPSEGDWTYEASFRTGDDIAATVAPNAGRATGFDGESGRFSVAPTDKTGEDFRAKGMILQAEGEHFLQHQGDGDYFVRGGPGVPENFLASGDFDGANETFAGIDDPDPGGGTLDRHQFANHLDDYDGDGRTWDGGKGEAVLGAVNYLADQNQNTIYLLTNTVSGDGQDVSPWVDEDLYRVGKHAKSIEAAANGTDGVEVDDFSVYDVSKLAQWEIVFDHMDAQGIYKNVLFQETENDQLLNGGTDVAGTTLSVERMVYMREMIARFGHNDGIQWNLGEENTQTDAERLDMAEWTKAVDPYDHLVVIHSFPGDHGRVYDPLLGDEAFDGPSFQTGAGNIRSRTIQYREESAAAGDPWVVAWDEDSGNNAIVTAYRTDADNANEKALRSGMWGHLTAGGSGVNWYLKGNGFGGHSFDQNLDDFEGFASIWTWTAAATEFYNNEIPFWEMTMADGLTPDGGDFVSAKTGEYYVAYRGYGQATDVEFDLSDQDGETFDVFWYDPRQGGDLIADGRVLGGAVRDIGDAPNDKGKDWVAFLRNAEFGDGPIAEPEPPVDPEPPTEPPAAGGVHRMRDGLVVMQAEDGAFLIPDASGNDTWTLETDQPGYKGDGYLKFDTNRDYFNDSNAGTPETSPLKYTFRVDGADAVGTYYITVRSIKPKTGEPSDRNNDFFVAAGPADEDPSGWKKVFFSGGANKWLWGSTYDVNHQKSPATFEIDGPGEYAIYVSGRSRQAGFDLIHVNKGAKSFDADAPTSPLADSPLPTPDPNATPVARDDAASVLAGEAVSIDVLGNDTDADGDALSIRIVDGPRQGRASVVDGEIRYVADADASGTDTIRYRAVDPDGARSGVATARVDVTAAPAEPDPQPGAPLFDVFLADTATDATIGALADGQTLVVGDLGVRPLTIYATATAEGLAAGVASVRLDAAGIDEQLENVSPYALFGDDAGDFADGAILGEGGYTVTLTAYAGTNGSGGVLGTQTVDFALADTPPVDLAPVARDDTAATDEDVAVAIDVRANDTDEDLAGTTIEIVSDPSGGAVAIANGEIVYTPAANANGADSFAYRLIDAGGLASGVATVSVDVAAVNDAPVLSDIDGGTVEQDAGLHALALSAADFGTDPDGTSLYFYEATARFGEVTLAGEGSTLLYTPAAGFSGTDTVEVTLWDQQDDGVLGTASASVEVIAAPDAPVDPDPALVKAINIGGPAYTGVDGTPYEADVYSDANTFAIGRSAGIAKTADDALGRSEAWSPDGLSYAFAVEDGTYAVELDFAEIWSGARKTGGRVFDIAIEGETVKKDYDIFAEVGFRALDTESFTVDVSDGTLDIDLLKGVQNPKLSAIRVFEVATAEPEPVSRYLDLFAADAGTDGTLGPVDQGATLDLDGLEATIFGVPKEGVSDIGSVRFSYDGTVQVENVEPYALFGDREGDFAGIAFAPGEHGIDVEVFSGRNAGGTLLETFEVSFVV